ncbi:AfsR/SARP family transcriptional regulator [Phycicoccus endophyticus]|uniref:AfsR/SARP family transcriptional regulator n=1 Tax=Phycicoccus endophyticus TaxID=1690220 RepID=A0A7G9R347_9MICO|nr:AfsR/SARP family transcriptional regulator [Phycicoccus endophyticus]NHI20317.1 AfsR/SARP family transcriptional regulator [Phycicoccus endophyticus]QNN50022.1 AfsR/SARP family transcriptional regulator [Phycicoccus endophyticus]
MPLTPGRPLLELEVLGSIRLSVGGERVRLSELEHGLLALAGLRGQVDLDSLADWLWDGEPPASARNRVQSLVSGVRRKAGREDVVVTEGRGYRLGGEVALDLAAWQAAVAAGRAARTEDPGRALAHYDAALAAFGHDPLQGAPATSAVELERERLGQERLSVLEERHESALRAGALDGLVAELAALTARHPLHEGFVALSMLALAATGRQGRALEVFQEARARLDDELGVRPSERLVEAQRVVLAGEAGQHLRAGPHPSRASVEEAPRALPVPRMLPRRPDTLLGRGRELAALRDAARALDQGAVVVAVTGLPGVGTSALALEAGHALRDLFPDGTLYHDAANEPGGIDTEAVLTSFLPLLGVHPEAVPSSPPARAGLLRSLLDGRRVLVVLDNVACVPGAGCDLADLLPASAGSMAVLTSRRAIEGLATDLHLRLRSLTTEPALALLAGLVGAERVAEEPEAAAEVVRLTGGLPLGLRLAAGRLAQRPDLGLDDLAGRLDQPGTGGRAPEGTLLRDSLGRLLEDLDTVTRHALGAVAQLPADTVSGWVVTATVQDAAAGEAALDAMVEAGLLEPVVREDHDTQYRLHDLVRSHVRAAAGPQGQPGHPDTRSATLAVAEAAVDRSAAFLEDRPYRFLPVPARPQGLRRVLPPPRVRRRSRRFFRTETPLFVSLARAVARDRPDLAWRLLADTALGTDASTDLYAWFEAEREVTGALRGADDDSRLGAAVLLLCRAWLLQDRRSASREARELAEAARPRLTLLGEHAAAAAASLVSAQAATSLGRREEATAAIAAAETQIARSGDPTLAAWAAIARGTVHNDYDELPESAREFTRAREILAETPRTVAYALATLELSRARRRTGELGAATLLVDESLEILSSVGAVHMYSYALDAQAEVSLAAGRFGDALEQAGTALERASASRDAFLTARARRTCGHARFLLGDLPGAEEDLRGAVEEFTALDRPLSVAFSYQVLAAVLDARGDPVGASEALRLEQAALRRASAGQLQGARRRSPGPA